jgi:hypothetical protein
MSDSTSEFLTAAGGGASAAAATVVTPDPARRGIAVPAGPLLANGIDPTVGRPVAPAAASRAGIGAGDAMSSSSTVPPAPAVSGAPLTSAEAALVSPDAVDARISAAPGAAPLNIDAPGGPLIGPVGVGTPDPIAGLVIEGGSALRPASSRAGRRVARTSASTSPEGRWGPNPPVTGKFHHVPASAYVVPFPRTCQE